MSAYDFRETPFETRYVREVLSHVVAMETARLMAQYSTSQIVEDTRAGGSGNLLTSYIAYAKVKEGDRMQTLYGHTWIHDEQDTLVYTLSEVFILDGKEIDRATAGVLLVSPHHGAFHYESIVSP